MTESLESDIIIVGAGTAGLVLANVLSEDPSLRIHIIETGGDYIHHPHIQKLDQWQSNHGTERDWQFGVIPQPGFAGKTTVQVAGKILGGSSSINGGYYVPPSRAGVNAWSKLGNPSWTYEAMHQACLETIQGHPPKEETVRTMSLTGSPVTTGTGPIQVTDDLEEHPITTAYFQALRELGYPTTTAIFNDNSAFGRIIYFTHDRPSKIRSDAYTAFGSILKQRSNVTISLETTVKRVILEGVAPKVIAKGVEIVTSDRKSANLFASKEVILSAGAFGTPKLLELSGIGQANLLRKHNIPVVINSPYVGERLRTHVMTPPIHCQLSGNGNIQPTSLGFKATAFMSSKDQPGLVEALKTYTSQPGDDQAYDDQVKAIFLDPKESSAFHFTGFVGKPDTWSFGVIMAVPFSKGHTHITSTNLMDKPTIDPCYFSHPLDLEVLSRHLKTAANFASQPALAHFFKIDDSGHPHDAAAVASMDLENVKEYIRQSSSGTYHPCGTTSMRPEEDGGVVDQQLKVYGTTNLRVVDASVIPLIAHGNPMAAVYGIAKRAAGFILESVSSR